MLAANSPLAGEYEQLFYGKLPWTPILSSTTCTQGFNDGLMAVFFFVVGLEVKREWIEGQLSTAQSRRLPILQRLPEWRSPRWSMSAWSAAKVN